jgi:predicted AAA+ superfamily ATPase
MYERLVEHRVKEALSDTPFVLIVGPRRAGKTTLVRKMGQVGRWGVANLAIGRAEPIITQRLRLVNL